MLPAEEEVLAHRRPGARRHPLDRRRLVGEGDDEDRVLHRARFAEAFDDLGDGRRLLTDRDVDADQVAPALVEDRVDDQRGLAGAAVAMISSRWPRPIRIIESIALMPVWSGSFTGWPRRRPAP